MLTPDIAVDLVSESLHITMVLVLLLVGPGLVMGLIVALFQAATQINEQTIGFVVKAMALVATIGLLGHFLLGRLVAFTQELYQRIPHLIG